MKRVNVIRVKAFLKVIAILVPLALNVNSLVAAPAVSSVGASRDVVAVPAAEGLHDVAQAAPEEEKAGDVIMHHILDNNVFAFDPFGEVHLPKLPPIAGIDISITKHVVMLWLVSAALLIVFSIVGGKYKNMTPRNAPKGLANAMEALVEFIRVDVAKSNIGHGYEKHLPYLLTVFFFILFCNLLGLIPYGATATGNVNVTLTLSVFSVISVLAGGFGDKFRNSTLAQKAVNRIAAAVFIALAIKLAISER